MFLNDTFQITLFEIANTNELLKLLFKYKRHKWKESTSNLENDHLYFKIF